MAAFRRFTSPNSEGMKVETHGYDQYQIWTKGDLMALGLSPKEAERLSRELHNMLRREMRAWRRVREHEVPAGHWVELSKIPATYGP